MGLAYSTQHLHTNPKRQSRQLDVGDLLGSFERSNRLVIDAVCGSRQTTLGFTVANHSRQNVVLIAMAIPQKAIDGHHRFTLIRRS